MSGFPAGIKAAVATHLLAHPTVVKVIARSRVTAFGKHSLESTWMDSIRGHIPNRITEKRTAEQPNSEPPNDEGWNRCALSVIYKNR